MAVWALGINHTTAPLDLRGRFAFALDQIAPTLQGLRQSLGQSSAIRAWKPPSFHLQPHRNLLRQHGRAGPYRWAGSPTAVA